MTKTESNWLIGSFFIGQAALLVLMKTRIGELLALPLFRLRLDSVALMAQVAQDMCDSNQYALIRGSPGGGQWERVALVKKFDGYNSFLPLITFVPRGESGGAIVFSTGTWLIVIFFIIMVFILKDGLRVFMGLVCLVWVVMLFAFSAYEVHRVKKLYVEPARRPDGTVGI